jgi:hypothetical protein
VYQLVCLLALSSGDVLIGRSVSDIVSVGILRLKSDGSLDTGFKEKPFPFETVQTLAELPDGKILAAGSFSAPGVIRLLPAGTLDGTFAFATSTGSWIRTMTIQPDNTIFLGGTFNGRDAESIARARQDPGSVYAPTLPKTFYSLRLEPNLRAISNLRFDRVVSTKGAIDMSLSGQSATPFKWQKSEDLKTWVTLGTNLSPSSGLVFRDLTASGRPRGFYRTAEMPGN